MEEKEIKENKVSEKVSETKSSVFSGQKLIRIEFAVIGAVLLLAAGLVVGSNMFPNSTTEIVISTETVNANRDMGELTIKVLEYVTKNLVPPGATATVTNIEAAGDNLYSVSINITLNGQTQPGTIYITGSGDRIILNGSILDTAVDLEQPKPEPEPVIELQKSDKPEVELFVMSHCPFGAQMEKGMLSVVETLDDKIDFEIRFVYYLMHGLDEMQEQLKQHCIEEEQNDKYLPYLKCFLKEGDTEACLAEAEIDTEALETCVIDADDEFQITANFLDTTKYMNDRYPLFGIDAEKNEEYGVGGSPTLVVNGTTVKSARDSASLLNTICGAFSEQPEECEIQLSSTAFSPGFGYDEGVSTDATCS